MSKLTPEQAEKVRKLRALYIQRDNTRHYLDSYTRRREYAKAENEILHLEQELGL